MYPDQINTVPQKKKLAGKELPHLFYKKGLRVSVFPQLEIKRVLDAFNPDIVHVQVSDPIGLSVVSYARRHNVPVVTTEHNQPEVLTDSLKMPRVLKKSTNYLLSAYFRNRQSKSDFVTMPTELAIRNLLKKQELGVPIAAVSNGVDLTHFKPGKAPKEIYEKYGLPMGRAIALYVGRVDPEKNVGLALKAFKKARDKLATEGIGPLFVVVGDGVDKARLKKLVQKLEIQGSVKFLGKILPPDLYEIYKVGSVFITASEIETQGIVLIEAAASGLPLVAVDRGAVSEICVNGENGFLCPAGDVTAISCALEKILSDGKLRERFSQASVGLASMHDFERTLDKFINIYTKVIADKK